MAGDKFLGVIKKLRSSIILNISTIVYLLDPCWGKKTVLKYSLGSAEGSVGDAGCRSGFGIGFVPLNFFEGTGQNG